MSDESHSPSTKSKAPLLLIGVLGIVYGDIGTSPLYAFRECFSGPHGQQVMQESVLGILSLITWSLISVISINYLGFILRADNRGEGGILTLAALLYSPDAPAKRRRLITALGLIGAALLCADAAITPAISILSAVEGLEARNPAFGPWVVPIALLVVAVLFFLQRHGTGRISSFFGPVMLVWFFALEILGLVWITKEPVVLQALSPHHGLIYAFNHPTATFLVLGSIFLVVTGGEALYADMGHFNRRSIRWGWFLIVLPALLCNYYGQGARLLHGPVQAGNLFFGMAPEWGVLPLVGLATVATVIASQAVITGLFSLANQAMQLGLVPRMDVRVTSEKVQGQIYVAFANALLFIGCCLLILEFRSSSALAGAYGLAVSGTMLATNILLFYVMRVLWKWSLVACTSLSVLFLLPCLVFFSSNLLKLADGGWIPLASAMALIIIMTTWRKGRSTLRDQIGLEVMPTDDFIKEIARGKATRVPGVAVFLSSNPGAVPRPLLHNYKHNRVLHTQNVFVSLDTETVPYVPRKRRIEARTLGEGFYEIHLRYGFRESPDVPSALQLAEVPDLSFNPMKTTYFLGRQTLVVDGNGSALMAPWRKKLFKFMFRNSLDPAAYFRLPPNRVVELGEQIRL